MSAGHGAPDTGGKASSCLFQLLGLQVFMAGLLYSKPRDHRLPSLLPGEASSASLLYTCLSQCEAPEIAMLISSSPKPEISHIYSVPFPTEVTFMCFRDLMRVSLWESISSVGSTFVGSTVFPLAPQTDGQDHNGQIF